jgi:hypothetical protein
MQFPKSFPLVRQITPQIRLLLQVVIVALVLFGIAHLVLFKLHLPSRYTAYTLRYVLAFSTAISFSLIFQGGLAALRRSQTHSTKQNTLRRALVWGIAALAGVALLIYPSTIPDFPKTNYLQGRIPNLYEYLSQQPPETIVAGVTQELDNISSFTNRSVLFSREFAIPYHVGYANQFRQRVEDFIRAAYSRNANTLISFLRTYEVDYLLLDRASFNPEYLEQGWIRQYPDAINEAKANLVEGRPALRRTVNPCTVAENEEQAVVLVQTSCVIQSLES